MCRLDVSLCMCSNSVGIAIWIFWRLVDPNSSCLLTVLRFSIVDNGLLNWKHFFYDLGFSLYFIWWNKKFKFLSTIVVCCRMYLQMNWILLGVDSDDKVFLCTLGEQIPPYLFHTACCALLSLQRYMQKWTSFRLSLFSLHKANIWFNVIQTTWKFSFYF